MRLPLDDPPGRPGYGRALIGWALVAGVLACPAASGALPSGGVEGGAGLWFGRLPRADASVDLGLGGQAHAGLGLIGPWGLEATGSGAWFFPEDQEVYAHWLAALGARFRVDDGAWDPFITGSLAYAGGDEPTDGTLQGLGVQLGIGLSLRFWPDVVPTIDLRYHVDLSEWESYPHLLLLSLRIDLAGTLWSTAAAP
ncbi:MAG: hypothetical protein RBU45_22930 [Myxococcota bacterium]|jgi:hypothetical protein|nr:hypothetical protein [Myxococcota bacterium]